MNLPVGEDKARQAGIHFRSISTWTRCPFRLIGPMANKQIWPRTLDHILGRDLFTLATWIPNCFHQARHTEVGEACGKPSLHGGSSGVSDQSQCCLALSPSFLTSPLTILRYPCRIGLL